MDKENVRTVKQERAVLTFKAAAKERGGEELEAMLESIELPFNVHKECARDYTKPGKVKASVRRKMNDEEGLKYFSPSPKKLRSSVDGYDEKVNCLFCAEMIETEQSKVPHDRRHGYSGFISLPGDIPKLMEKCEEVDNQFVQRLLLVFSSIWLL